MKLPAHVHFVATYAFEFVLALNEPSPANPATTRNTLQLLSQAVALISQLASASRFVLDSVDVKSDSRVGLCMRQLDSQWSEAA